MSTSTLLQHETLAKADHYGTYASAKSMESVPAYNLAPSNFAHWRKALARVRSGQGDAVLLCVGDSTTYGKGSISNATSQPLGGYPTYLADMLNSIIPAARGLMVPPSLLNTGIDNRWTIGGTGVSSPFGSGFGAGGGAAYMLASSSTGTLTYADAGVMADTFDVYYLGTATTGKVTITATGGSATVVTTTNGTANIYKATVTAASAATTNGVTMQWAAGGVGGNVYIVGVTPRLSTTSKVRVGNAGVGSASTTNWVTNTSNLGGRSLIKAVAPDLTIISLGINDGNASVDTATFLANMQTLIGDAQVSGDVIVMSMPPSSGTPVSTLEPGYVAALAGLGLPYIDWYTRVGTYAAYNALGMMFDTLHPNSYGYADIAEAVYAVLRNV